MQSLIKLLCVELYRHCGPPSVDNWKDDGGGKRQRSAARSALAGRHANRRHAPRGNQTPEPSSALCGPETLSSSTLTRSEASNELVGHPLASIRRRHRWGRPFASCSRRRRNKLRPKFALKSTVKLPQHGYNRLSSHRRAHHYPRAGCSRVVSPSQSLQTPVTRSPHSARETERCRTGATVIKTLLRLLEASTQYDFQPVEGITERCLWIGALSDDEIRRHSEDLE